MVVLSHAEVVAVLAAAVFLQVFMAVVLGAEVKRLRESNVDEFVRRRVAEQQLERWLREHEAAAKRLNWYVLRRPE